MSTTPSLRKQNEVKEIYAVEATEAYSVVVPNRFTQAIADAFRSHGLQVTVATNAIGGHDPQDDIQVSKSIPFDQLVQHLSEWKQTYAMS